MTDSLISVSLENWGILKRIGQNFFPTNAFILLTNNTFRFAKIQCALFKGENRAVFLGKREFNGPLYTQIDEAYQFVLKHINLGATIEGIIRKDKYELPPESIREAIINSVCHRLWKAFHNLCKTTTVGSLGIGLAIDVDAQGSLTVSLGYPEPDKMEVTLASILGKIINEEDLEQGEGILHHGEGIDLMPGEFRRMKFPRCWTLLPLCCGIKNLHPNQPARTVRLVGHSVRL